MSSNTNRIHDWWKLDAWGPCDVHCMYNYIYHMRSLFHNPHKLSFIVQIRRISVIEPDITLGHAIKKNPTRTWNGIIFTMRMGEFNIEFWAGRTISNTPSIAECLCYGEYGNKWVYNVYTIVHCMLMLR